MKQGCAHEGCENTPRYLNAMSEARCGLHDLEDPWPSVRVTDLGLLIIVAATIADDAEMPLKLGEAREKLKEIVCRKKIR